MRCAIPVFLMLFTLPLLAGQGHDRHAMQPAAAAPDSVYQIEGNWRDQHGAPLQLKDFTGGPVVLTMVYTGCATACPILTHDLQRINHALGNHHGQPLRKVLVSLDHERDTPSRLMDYARQRGLDRPDWSLLSGDRGSIRELATLLGIRYRQLPDGGYSHSNLIVVLDEKGVIRHRQAGLGEPVDTAAEAVRSVLDGPENP